jgi:heat shock protein HtpX
MGNWFKTTLLLGVLTALIVWLGNIFAFILAMGMNLFSYWYSDKIVLRMYQENPGLYEMVNQIAGIANIPMPRIYMIPESSPDAFATGRNPGIISSIP